MRRFLAGCAIAIFLLFILNYCIYYRGMYFDLHPDGTVHASVKTEGKQIMVKRDGVFEPFQVKGIDVDSSIPGKFSTDFAVSEEDYFRWFSMMQDMGANTVRVYTLMNDGFYNALYEYNEGKKDPLYLLQGLRVTDYANDNSEDAYSREFYGELKKDVLSAVDIIHGRKKLLTSKVKGSGHYKKDVSQWVLGYVIGLQWNPKTIAYTDRTYKEEPRFDGTYIGVTKEAAAFESLLADIMDSVVSYESRKYKEQRLVSFISDPSVDAFSYEEEYGRQIGKYACIDMEHMRVKDTVVSGFFASYHLYEYCPEFVSYFTEEQKEKLTPVLEKLNKELYYEGYTQLLSEYHTMPVVITGYGFSSARGSDQEGKDESKAAMVLTEAEQGRELADTYKDIVSSGCAGATITSWQDVWGQRSWNTSYAVGVTYASRWSDAQTSDQGYGLLAFDPGKEESACYPDGDISEWTGEDLVSENKDMGISCKYDERYLYLMIEKPGLSEEEMLYIPIDTTQKSGSSRCKNLGLEFEREADFVICLQGREDSRIIVQERYEALRANYLQNVEGADPFARYPDKDSEEFVPVRMILKQSGVAEDAYDENGVRKRRLSQVFETGRLTFGNANPASRDYRSDADVCYADDSVELRIPWQLLNFYDPSNMMIHDDYYEHYGVKPVKIRKCYIGVTQAGYAAPARMDKVNLKGWGRRPKYHERKKQSYYVLQQYWTGGRGYAG